MPEQLNVYLNGEPIGVVRPDRRDRKRITFQLDGAYRGAPNALSEGFALISGLDTSEEHLSRFLGGYLPEGRHRIRLAERARVDESDLFGMFARYGLTMAGALSLRSDEPHDNTHPDYRPLSDSDLRRKLDRARDDYDLGNEPDSGRSTIAGFQAKLLLARFDGRWHQPLRRAHSTHIVKPQRASTPELIVDEFYSHQLTRHMGLSSFGSELLDVAGSRYLAIERYDRRIVGSNDVSIIHQEDAAQALGLDWVNSTAKFQDHEASNRKDRPTAARIAELFGSMDDADVEAWLRYITFSILAGNSDAHAKNVSIIHDDFGSRIADLYDAVPLLHVNDDPERLREHRRLDRLALAVDGEFSHHSVTAESLANEAESWGSLAPSRIQYILNDTMERFASALEAETPQAGASTGLKDRLGYNVDRLGAGKSIGKPKLPVNVWVHGRS